MVAKIFEEDYIARMLIEGVQNSIAKKNTVCRICWVHLKHTSYQNVRHVVKGRLVATCSLSAMLQIFNIIIYIFLALPSESVSQISASILRSLCWVWIAVCDTSLDWSMAASLHVNHNQIRITSRDPKLWWNWGLYMFRKVKMKGMSSCVDWTQRRTPQYQGS